MKKYLSFVAFAMFLAATCVSLTACGGDDDDADTGGSPTPPEKPLTPEGAKAMAVDLGLPSGTLWADRNVGASKPQQDGSYFAWGETQSKDEYSWSTYKYGKDKEELTKYCSNLVFGKDGYTDATNPEIGRELTELLLEDDVANVNWGGKWRMPSKEQIYELYNNTDHVWEENFQGTKVRGMKFTNKNDNSKYIFLPAAGKYYASFLINAGISGDYWTRELYTYNENMFNFNANSYKITNYNSATFENGPRCDGLTVRAVIEP